MHYITGGASVKEVNIIEDIGKGIDVRDLKEREVKEADGRAGTDHKTNDEGRRKEKPE